MSSLSGSMPGRIITHTCHTNVIGQERRSQYSIQTVGSCGEHYMSCGEHYMSIPACQEHYAACQVGRIITHTCHTNVIGQERRSQYQYTELVRKYARWLHVDEHYMYMSSLSGSMPGRIITHTCHTNVIGQERRSQYSLQTVGFMWGTLHVQLVRKYAR